jgi:hypothetical protein
LKTRKFITDKEIKSDHTAFEISREYLSTNKNDEPVEVGDLVIVEFAIKNLGLSERDLEIIDYLPTGLVAIDQSLDNGVFDSVQTDNIGKQKISGQTVELKIDFTKQNNATFRYKARVISKGIFDTPPAIIRHASDPSLWARSNSTRLVIDGKNKLKMLETNYETTELNSIKSSNNYEVLWRLLVLVAVISLITTGYGIWINKEALLTKFKKPTHKDETPLS